MPSGIAQDKDGNVYIANGVGTRKVNAQGQVTMLEGGDILDNVIGTRYFSPRGVTLDSKGNLLRLELAGRITRTAPAGTVTVLHTNGPNANGIPPNFYDTFFAGDKEDDLIVLDNVGLLYRAVISPPRHLLTTNGGTSIQVVWQWVGRTNINQWCLPKRNCFANCVKKSARATVMAC
jgi:hypothetical protein